MKSISIEDIEEVYLWICPYKRCSKENEDFGLYPIDGEELKCKYCGKKVKVKEK